MVEGQTTVECFRRIDNALQKLAVFGGRKNKDEVNVHVVFILAPSKHGKLLLGLDVLRTIVSAGVFAPYLPCSLQLLSKEDRGEAVRLVESEYAMRILWKYRYSTAKIVRSWRMQG